MTARGWRARGFAVRAVGGVLLGSLAFAIWAAVRADATFPGRNGKIVVVREIGNSVRQIYIGGRSGRLRLLSRGFGFAAGPDVSPDGRRVVFKGRRNGDSRQQIWSIRPDGSGLQQLTYHDTDSLGPAYAADGRFVLYDSYVDDPDRSRLGIRRLDLRTGSDRPLLPLGTRSPAVSPRGRIFAFVDQRGTGYSEIWTARVNGARPRPLTHERYWADQPDFSPSGSWVVYSTLRPCAGGHRTAIVAIHVSGDRKRLLAKGCRARVSAPVFSPNGRLVVFFQNGVARTVRFANPQRPGHLLSHRPRGAVDSNLAWQAR